MKAVTYIRVSTDEEKQLNAFAKQREEAAKCAEENGWELVDEYLDEGKSGTSTSNRTNYNRLYGDLVSDKFDVVIIKSQDRLMRNVKDWYLFLSRLVENGKKLFFYLDNRFYQSDDSLITGIKAILAEEYSRDLSKKLNNSNKRRQESGSSLITNGSTWGYDQVNGELIINETEAAIVRRIFDMYINGSGARLIKQTLDTEGVVSKRGTQIGLTTIKRMIKNPLYVGTVVQNRIHKDFDSKRIISVPEDQWRIHENRVQPIIDKDTFEKAVAICESRTNGGTTGVKKGARRGSHDLSGKIKCGECGKNYRRTLCKSGKEIKAFWYCGAYQTYGKRHPRNGGPERINGCDGKMIKESIILEALESVVCKYDEEFIPAAKIALEKLSYAFEQTASTCNVKQVSNKIDEIEFKKSKLLDSMLDGFVSPDNYRNKVDELDQKISELKEKIKTAEQEDGRRSDICGRIAALKQEIESKCRIETKKKYIMSHVKTITVFQDRLEVDFDIFDSIVFDLLPMCPQQDRIDIHIEMPEVGYAELAGKSTGEPSRVIRARVNAARERQRSRFASDGILCNAQMNSALIKRYCSPDQKSEELLKRAFTEMQLSARAYQRILKVARTVADVEGSEAILPAHYAEAIQYRSLDGGGIG